MCVCSDYYYEIVFHSMMFSCSIAACLSPQTVQWETLFFPCLMESQGDDEQNNGPEDDVPPSQCPIPPASQAPAVGRKVSGKRKRLGKSPAPDPRLDLMQRHLEDIRKTIDCMAAQQRRPLGSAATGSSMKASRS